MHRVVVPLVLVAALVGCSDNNDSSAREDVGSFTLRVQLLTADNAVVVWGRAENIEEAHAAAEAAANLIVGAGGPGYGDRDGNGTVDGESDFGIFPSIDGETPGLAALVDNECITSDVLGGSWDDPAARWAEMDEAVAAWTPDNNTLARLASDPVRVVAWAELALATDSLDDARDYGTRARTNVTSALAAIDC